MWMIHVCSILFYIMGQVNGGLIEAKARRSYFEGQGVVWEVPTKQKVIALTFDDGPSPRNTTLILQILKQNHAKATFFVTGWRVERYPSILKQEVLEGHEIGNHTYSHPAIWHVPEKRIREEIKKTEKLIVSATGVKPPRIFRPVGGYVSDKVINAAKQLGYTVVLWSWDEDSLDWKRRSAKRMIRQVVGNAHNGDIILFHDHGARTVQALKVILPQLQKEGFKFVTVSELLQIKGLQDINRIMELK